MVVQWGWGSVIFFSVQLEKKNRTIYLNSPVFPYGKSKRVERPQTNVKLQEKGYKLIKGFFDEKTKNRGKIETTSSSLSSSASCRFENDEEKLCFPNRIWDFFFFFFFSACSFFKYILNLDYRFRFFLVFYFILCFFSSFCQCR